MKHTRHISAVIRGLILLTASCMMSQACSRNEEEPGNTIVPERPPRPEVPPGIELTPGVLSNPDASEVTRRVYDFLVENHGKKILSGAMANVDNNNDFAAWVATHAGVHPAVNGYDLIQLDRSQSGGWIDYDDISPALDHWNANGLVCYMWHWRVPTDYEAYISHNSDRFAFYSPDFDGEGTVTHFDIERALTSGTWENECILADIDRVATIFMKLRDSGVPVIWRPLHEAAGSYRYGKSWFWWGAKGGKATAKLWKLMYHRLVEHHKLDNLIWVWTAQYDKGFEHMLADDYPGNEYVDVIGADIYSEDDSSHSDAYAALMKLGNNNRLVALSETGRLPSPVKCIEDNTYWSWFMQWYTYDIHKTGNQTDAFGNTSAGIKLVFSDKYVLNREDMPDLKIKN